MNETYAIEQLLAGRRMASVARELGLTRERIRQIADRHGLINCSLCSLKVKQGAGLCGQCLAQLPILIDSTISHCAAALDLEIKVRVVSDKRQRLGVVAAHGRCRIPRPVPTEIIDPTASPKELARKYGVTADAVVKIRKAHGICRANSIMRRPWTDRDDGLLRDMLGAGASRRYIAKQLERTVPAINSRITWLGWRNSKRYQ